LGKRSGYDDEDGLDEEGHGEDEFPLRVTCPAVELRKEQAACPKGGYRDEGAQPEGWLVGGQVGCPEGEEDGVAC